MENRNLTHALKEYVDAYNSWPHAVTLMPPSDLMFARAFRGNFPVSELAEIIDATQEEILERDRIAKMKSKLYQDRLMQAKITTIDVNDEVYILKKGQTKLSPRFGDTKLRVLGKSGSQLTLQSPSGDIIVRSVDHVTKSITDKDIENYVNEKRKAATHISQKSIYEENKPIIVEEDVDKEEEEDQTSNGLPDSRRPSRQIRIPKRYLCAINERDVYVPAMEYP